jgi:RNA-directed DNA polymerase
MEKAAGAASQWNPCRGAMDSVPGTPVLVRYADDFVVLCDSRDQAEQARTRLAPWLASRGLTFNEGKTRIVPLREGFDFLGFNVRRYRNGKLLIKPSADAVRRARRRLSAEMRALRGASAAAVLQTINPIVRGWSAYYRSVVSAETFSDLDRHLWLLSYKWACYRHHNKPKRWIIHRYYGQFHPARKDQWVFGDRDSGALLIKFSWTKIIRHDLVKGSASPDDPALTSYWASRQRRAWSQPPIDRASRRLLHEQHGRCPACGRYLLHAYHQPANPAEWEQWLKTATKAISSQLITTARTGPPETTRPRLIHTSCQRRLTTGSPALLAARKPSRPA